VKCQVVVTNSASLKLMGMQNLGKTWAVHEVKQYDITHGCEQRKSLAKKTKFSDHGQIY
jgi:hypothetical protein